ncbi:MAG: hypothetical protein QM817_07940 [Archangium sp.]
MSDHLSALQLDELAAGGVPDAHLNSCTECTAKFEALKKQNEAVLAMPQARALESKLISQHVAKPLAAPMRALLVLAPLAASLLLFFLWPKDSIEEENRIKGAPMVMLLDAKGATVTTAKVGDALSLALKFSGTEKRKVTVFAADTSGKREQLWSGDVQPNERAVISTLQVTPGDVEVIAEFGPPASQSLRVGVQPIIVSTKLEVK